MSEGGNKRSNMPKGFKFNLYWVYGIIALFLIGLSFMGESPRGKEISYNEIGDLVKSKAIQKINVITNKNEAEITILPEKIADVYGKDSASMVRNPVLMLQIPSADQFTEDLKEWKKEYGNDDIKITYESESDYIGNFLWGVGPIILLIFFWVFMMRRMSGTGGAGGVFSVGQSKAKLFDKGSAENKVTFKDVAGLSEAKEEVQEIVHFLKNPKKYTELGGKIPKGALLVGPPGTGKTLLAKAVAGEAEVPFFSMSGSDFVEMFVGVGASRVRDLFRQAKEKSPCIVFIDEIDAVGRARGRNLNTGSNDERENTLNQLLTEMDGFGSNSGVIILAATNRADVLDKALLRPGRFDRQIMVDLPDVHDRQAIFNVHLRSVKIDESVNVEFLARQTPGFSVPDIANVCNEAALIAARKSKMFVQKQDFLDAVDRIIGGLEKKNTILTRAEKESTAYHEAGHATVSWMLRYANPLIKVTIVPRGRALGAAWYLPEERQHVTSSHLLDDICATLGGRAAEELIYGEVSTGALNDLENTTKKAYAMIVYYGFSDKLKNLSYYDSSGRSDYAFSKPYSEETSKLIDEEVKVLINEQYERAKSILSENMDGLRQLASILIEKEVIFAEDVERIFGKRPWISRAEELNAESEQVKENSESSVSSENQENKANDETKDESVVEAENVKIEEIGHENGSI
ncbi:MAG: ATP-dependent zinc metalloprotease FtsH [Paludibacteraceae bacterium]|nr:ATP-dependent zinc metalloprotease FtsH [Paludibacteraceae bacterium]